MEYCQLDGSNYRSRRQLKPKYGEQAKVRGCAEVVMPVNVTSNPVFSTLLIGFDWQWLHIVPYRWEEVEEAAQTKKTKNILSRILA